MLVFREAKQPDEESVDSAETEHYDVFLSYAHADEDKCKLVLSTLQKEIPGVKVFVDREGLQTGKAVDGSSSCLCRIY